MPSGGLQHYCRGVRVVEHVDKIEGGRRVMAEAMATSAANASRLRAAANRGTGE